MATAVEELVRVMRGVVVAFPDASVATGVLVAVVEAVMYGSLPPLKEDAFAGFGNDCKSDSQLLPDAATIA
jgi:hypothetical protein